MIKRLKIDNPQGEARKTDNGDTEKAYKGGAMEKTTYSLMLRGVFILLVFIFA
jgi:hypothetical protein